MHSFIMKITHSLPAKDTIAVARGLYKVIEGGIYTSRAERVDTKLAKSWHDITPRPQPNQLNHQFDQQNVDKDRVNIQKQKKQTIQTPIYQQKQTKISNQTSKNHINQSIKPQILKTNTKAEQQIPPKQTKLQKNTPKTQKKPDYRQFLQNQSNSQVNRKQMNKNVVQSKVPSSRISRIFQFTKLGLNIAESAVQVYFTSDKDLTKQNATYERIANKISDELCKMRGAPLKLAQMLSIQEDKLIPTPIRRAFQKARETAHILPPQEVLYMMEKNFGTEWRKKFILFEQKPFASASIGQVHKAYIETIGHVAIKIQYPGVRRSIESDISNLHLLLKIPGVFPKGMYMDKILKNTKAQLTEQCDYLLQKQKQQAYDQCMKQCLGEDAYKLFKVPKVYDEFTTEQVFTSEYLQGMTMKQLQESEVHQEVKDQIGRRIMEITFNELFEMGIVQSDPNPANFTYNFKQDQLNLFDFGATHIYKKKFLEDYFRIIEGSVLMNKEQIIQASKDVGFLTGQQGQAMKENHVQSILITGEPLRYAGKYDFGNQLITAKIYKTIPVMLKNRLKSPPQEVYSLHRKLSGSYLACMRLKARVDCSKIWQEIKFQRIISRIDLVGQKSRLVI